MIRKKHKIIYWIPRILSVAITVLVFLLAFGCFSNAPADQSDWTVKEKFICFLWQLIPAALIAVITRVAWKLELYGGFLFFLAGLFYLIIFYSKMDIWSFIFLPGMAMFIGLMFWLNKYLRRNEDDIIIC